MSYDVFIVWCIYIAALEAQKKRRFTRTLTWQRDLGGVRQALADEGLTL